MQDLIARIQMLKAEKDAIILAHNYQSDEVQDLADFTGDSLGLSMTAAKTDAKVIVFCGVYFMAETAAILSPNKTVLLPDLNAGCPMADMINAKDLRELKAKNPGVPVVCYVNSSAEVKAESDYCCTSANAVNVVRSLKEKKIIFIPDRYLGAFVQKSLPEKELILWSGYCPTHARITAKDIEAARAAHPESEVLVHPECTPEAINAADRALSTEGMLNYAASGESNDYIIGTEIGILHRLRKENPGKHFYPVSEKAICPNMKRTDLGKILNALEEFSRNPQNCEFAVKVAPEIAKKAKLAIDKMITIGRQD
jgi:quinolinate synthase